MTLTRSVHIRTRRGPTVASPVAAVAAGASKIYGKNEVVDVQAGNPIYVLSDTLDLPSSGVLYVNAWANSEKPHPSNIFTSLSDPFDYYTLSFSESMPQWPAWLSNKKYPVSHASVVVDIPFQLHCSAGIRVNAGEYTMKVVFYGANASGFHTDIGYSAVLGVGAFGFEDGSNE